jgi:hypothetical protein
MIETNAIEASAKVRQLFDHFANHERRQGFGSLPPVGIRIGDDAMNWLNAKNATSVGTAPLGRRHTLQCD